MSKNKIEFGKSFNFKDEFLVKESIAEIRERLDTYDIAEVITWAVFKFGLAAAIFLFKNVGAGLLSWKAIRAALNTEIGEIVLDGKGEIFDTLSSHTFFVGSAIKFTFTPKDEDRENIIGIMKLMKSGTETDRNRFILESYAYSELHNVSLDEAKVEVIKTFKV